MATSFAAASTPKPNSMSARNAELLESGKYTDLTIICKGKTFHLHRGIVCMASKFFAAACDGNFKEATTGVIDLDDDDPEAFERMIRYIYTETYCDNRKIATATASRPPSNAQKIQGVPQALLLNANVYIIAEKYDVQGLKTLAATKYAEVLEGEGQTPSFVASLKRIYENTLDGDIAIRKPAMEFAAKHIAELMKQSTFAALLLEHAHIGVDVLKGITTPKPFALSKMCPKCNSEEYVRTNSKYEREHQKMPQLPRYFQDRAMSGWKGLYNCGKCDNNFD